MKMSLPLCGSAALWGRGFCPAAGLLPGVVWQRNELTGGLVPK